MKFAACAIWQFQLRGSRLACDIGGCLSTTPGGVDERPELEATAFFRGCREGDSEGMREGVPSLSAHLVDAFSVRLFLWVPTPRRANDVCAPLC